MAYSEYDGEFYFGNGDGIPTSLTSIGQDIWRSDALRLKVLKLPNNDMRMTYDNGTTIYFRPIVLGYQTVMYRPYVMSDRNGNTLQLTWNNDDQLETVLDELGRAITFSYNAQGKLIRVEEPAGRKVVFDYDTHRNIQRITVHHAGDTKYTEFTYSSGFPATQDYLNHNMLTIVDSKGQTYVTNTYNSDDEVSQQIYGGDTYSYDYTHNAQGGIIGVDVTNGRGVETEYTMSNGLVTRRARTTMIGGTEVYTMAYNTE